MFNNLVASEGEKPAWQRHPVLVIGSAVLHVLLIAGAVWATTREREPEPEEPEPEEITYINVSEVPPPPEPAQPEPAPQQPQQAPQPAPQPTRQPVQQPENPKGFQTLEPPEEIMEGIPEPDLDAEPVEAEDFSGRGVVGGTAEGEPVQALPTGGESEGTGTGGAGTGEGTYTARLVDEPATLANRSEVARILREQYPQGLRELGIEGRVVVQFVVTPTGQVDMSTVKVLSATDEGFRQPTIDALRQFRFHPATVGGRNVRMLMRIPITWRIRF